MAEVLLLTQMSANEHFYCMACRYYGITPKFHPSFLDEDTLDRLYEAQGFAKAEPMRFLFIVEDRGVYIFLRRKTRGHWYLSAVRQVGSDRLALCVLGNAPKGVIAAFPWRVDRIEDHGCVVAGKDRWADNLLTYKKLSALVRAHEEEVLPFTEYGVGYPPA